MSRFKRPNPDTWLCIDVACERSFAAGELRLELWQADDGDQAWVYVVDDGRYAEHAPLSDAMAAMLLRVMRDE